MDEDLEERFLIRQKLMRNRYSKLLRRRSMWEGDEHAQNPIWARSRRWLVTSWADKKTLSYQRALRAEMEEQRKRADHERPWKEWDRDYDKLKARIDEAMERDPYGTLFGRHLRGPPSPNNSSWTSFSWIYGPLKSMPREATETVKENSSQAEKPSAQESTKPSHTAFSVPPIAPSNTPASRASPVEQEYEFDPITMRKIPKRTQAPDVPITSSSISQGPAPLKQAFLETLFSEHGVDIPVKTYKPHKVYGHGDHMETGKMKTELAKPKISGIGVESSRLRDLQALRFRTLGTSIDTTAEYGGKFKVATDPDPIHLTSAKDEPTTSPPNEISMTHDVKDVSGEDSAALFTGTTYEAKAKSITATTAPKPSFNSWLMKEGFQTLPQALSKAETERKESPTPATADVETTSSRIEPALDRVKAFDVKTRNKGEATLLEERAPSSDTAEDVDLLRASDVRAATRSARMTRQELEESKQRARKQLEEDYSKRQIDEAATVLNNTKSTKERMSRSLNTVWDHVKQYPQGIVAKTIKSMGVFSDNYKTYVRLDKPPQDPTEKLVFKDESLRRTPSIYKKIGKKSTEPLHTFTPSQEVIDVENAEKARLAFVRQVNEESKTKARAESKRAEELASEIRTAYEEEYGKIDVNHRQPGSIPNAAIQSVSPPELQPTALSEFKKPSGALQPMGPATVKPSVEEDPVIRDHVSIFEPKLAKMVDEAKSTRRVLHEAKLEVMALRSSRPQTVWSDQSSESTANQEILARSSELLEQPRREHLERLKREEEERILAVQMKQEECMKKEDHLERETPRIEPALDRSQEKQTSPEQANKTSDPSPQPKYDSEYIILAYDPSSKTVTTSPLDSSTPSKQDSSRKTGVPQILASLNHTAKFLSHFASLSNQGYEVVSGGGDVLVFKRRGVKSEEPALKSPLIAHVKAIIDKNKLAAQEASAQPETKTIPTRKAATVLDEMPASEPNPDPAGPSAPPLGPPSFMRPKVRRQEDVFSASKASRVPPSSTAEKMRKEKEDVAKQTPIAQEQPPKTKEGLWTRFKSSVRRVFLTAAAMGAGAYTIGVVAESLGAQHQPQKLTQGGRPGIYSTENSR